MNNDDLLKKLLEFRKVRDWQKFHTPANLAKSISIEAGELLECFQWREDNYNSNDVSQEMADIYIYLLYLSHVLKIDLNQVAFKKIKANEQRYTIDKSKGNANKHK